MARKTNYSFEKRRKEIDKKKKKDAKLQRKLEKKIEGEGPPIAEFDNGLDPLPEAVDDEDSDDEDSDDEDSDDE